MSLIGDFDSGKKPYQTFLIEMGIERVTAYIPLANADAFEQSASLRRPKNRSELQELVGEVGGRLEG